MSYATKYGNSRFDIKRKPRFKGEIFFFIILIAFIIIFHHYMPNTYGRIREALFPFSESGVRSAFYATAKSIRAGEDPAEAITAFCREIIHEGPY